jgi:hypothetical protein
LDQGQISIEVVPDNLVVVLKGPTRARPVTAEAHLPASGDDRRSGTDHMRCGED